ncbi:MAG: hypothetical protein Q4F64_08015 [Corynebacterium casei]|nr:hypothetical protein [Corynebacterium casei]
MVRLIRAGTAIAGFGIAALLLASCNTSGPLLAHLKTFESDIAGEPADATASLDEVYGPEWTEFATICPYTPQKNVHEALGTEDSPISEQGLQDSENYLYLKSGDGTDDSEEKWIRFTTAELDFCNPTNTSSQSLTLKATSDTLDFTLIQPDSRWTLTDFGN